MKKHMTQSELTRTTRLVEQGVTKISDIQTIIFCDASCIKRVIDKVARQADPELAAAKALAKKEQDEADEAQAEVDKLATSKATKPQGAAAKAAAAKTGKVDPLT